MSMSIKHRTETPNIPYGPATGVPTPEPHNEARITSTAMTAHRVPQIMQSRDMCRAAPVTKIVTTSKGDL